MAPALAQSADSDGVTGRLIELLVKRGVLQRDDAQALLAEARAKPTKTAAKPAKPPAVAAAKAAEEPAAPGTVRVTYVPQFVRDQIAQQVRADMMQAAASGQTAAAGAMPGAMPSALDRFHFFGDLRIRGELDQLPKSNVPQILDFSALNGGSPFDLTGGGGRPPLLDTTHNRAPRASARPGRRGRRHR